MRSSKWLVFRRSRLAGFDRSLTKAQFMYDACKRLAKHPETNNLRWLLTRRYPEIFALPSELAAAASPGPAEGPPPFLQRVLERARELAKLRDDAEEGDRCGRGSVLPALEIQ